MSNTTAEIQLSYVPTRTQTRLHRSAATYLLFGGALGGGKSVALVNDCLAFGLRHPGTRCGLYRYEQSSFRRTTGKTMRKWILGVEGLAVDHAQSKNEITLCNGSTIVYGGLKPSRSQSGDPMSVIRSLELGGVWVDEASDLPEDVFDFLTSRVGRATCADGSFPPPRVVLSSNPSLGWIKHRFIDSRLPDHAYVPSRVRDNPHLPKSYAANLRRQWASSPQIGEALLDGRWDVLVDTDAVFPPGLLLVATRNPATPVGGVAFGVDVAAFGDDSSVVVMRKGLSVRVLWQARKQSTMDLVSQVAMLADRYTPERINIDSIGVGQGVYDRLNEMNYPVFAMVGGEKPADERYLNRRAELYFELRGLLEAGKVGLPDDAKLINELGSIRFLLSQSDRTIQVESKANIRKRLGRSPDLADAVVYAFADAAEDVPQVVSVPSPWARRY